MSDRVQSRDAYASKKYYTGEEFLFSDLYKEKKIYIGFGWQAYLFYAN